MVSEYRFFAGFYDPCLSPFLRGMREKMGDALAGHRSARVVDLCCGTGSQLNILKLRGFTRLHGVDASPSMLRVAKRQTEGVRYWLGDAARTAFPTGAFDVAIISLALHEKSPDEQRRLIGESWRILKPGGVLMVADFAFDGGSSFLSRSAIRSVEFVAGGNHYRNFRRYLRKGGLKGIIPSSRFDLKMTERALSGGIAINSYVRLPEGVRDAKARKDRDGKP